MRDVLLNLRVARFILLFPQLRLKKTLEILCRPMNARLPATSKAPTPQTTIEIPHLCEADFLWTRTWWCICWWYHMNRLRGRILIMHLYKQAVRPHQPSKKVKS